MVFDRVNEISERRIAGAFPRCEMLVQSCVGIIHHLHPRQPGVGWVVEAHPNVGGVLGEDEISGVEEAEDWPPCGGGGGIGRPFDCALC